MPIQTSCALRKVIASYRRFEWKTGAAQGCRERACAVMRAFLAAVFYDAQPCHRRFISFRSSFALPLWGVERKLRIPKAMSIRRRTPPREGTLASTPMVAAIMGDVRNSRRAVWWPPTGIAINPAIACVMVSAMWWVMVAKQPPTKTVGRRVDVVKTVCAAHETAFVWRHR